MPRETLSVHDNEGTLRADLSFDRLEANRLRCAFLKIGFIALLDAVDRHADFRYLLPSDENHTVRALDGSYRTRCIQRAAHVGAAVKPFRYALDPLCLAAIGLYVLNRWLIGAHLHSAFLHSNFNDLLTVPAALPPVLWAQRLLGWRLHDGAPRIFEILLHAAIWSIICEGLGPFLFHHGTADWMDVVAYFVGGAVALLVWNRRAPASCEAA